MGTDSNFPPGFIVVRVSGPLILAHLGIWALTGILTVQLYLYYQAFPNDRRFTKCLVYTMYSLQFLQIILTTLDSFAIFGYGFGDFAALTNVQLAWFTGPISTAMASLIVQSFYAFRLHSFSKSRIIPVLIVAAALIVSASGLMTGIFVFPDGDVTGLNTRKISIALGLWLIGSALVDVIIAISMTYYLIISDTGFRQTHALISRLIRLTIQTGSMTALGALATVILFFGCPGKDYYVTPGNYMPALYANTMLAVLNSRFHISDSRPPFSEMDIMSFPTVMLRPGTNPGRTHAISDGDMGGPMTRKPGHDSD
ncbi:hypothetical protein DFH07DRAFT_796251 [Mycena maculata]|uniref:DUF6534 domain-containing protein n=1 Tax=Mycena maculata TaxID=230809 RepID=A0AAD7NXC2_9AGAR|nr:hypothetical protein DFH07DRAFT_796251 [Mycena maculata]